MEPNTESKSTMCKICANVFTTPEALRRFVDTGRAELCRGTRAETKCLLRQTTFLWIEKAKPLSRSLIYDEDPGVVLFNMGGRLGENSAKCWYDISRIEVYMLPNAESKGSGMHIQSLVVCTPADDPAAPFVTTRPLSQDLGPTSRSFVESCIRNCSENHENCPTPDSSWLPTRVLDVGKSPADATADLRLHTVNDDREHYTALSYCWGGPQKVALTQATIADKHMLIKLASLPKTIQDAIVTTRLLGVRFLWVDALCIIQDSADDKNLELSMMDRVYKNSYVTISAASATTCYDGFLEPRKPPLATHPDLKFGYRCSESEPMGSIILTEDIYYDARLEPINSRAWTYQERILVPRLLIYGTSQMRWQYQAEDVSYGGLARSYSPGSERLIKMFFASKAVVTNENQILALDDWLEILGDYTRRQLSFGADKLVAIAAVALLFEPYCGTYLAGLWSHPRLVEQLCWMVDQSALEILKTRATGYIAPSWSCASIQNTVSFGCFRKVPLAVVEHCSTVPVMGSFSTGAVISGLLILRAPFRQRRLKIAGSLVSVEGTLQERPISLGQVWLDAKEVTAGDAWCLKPTVEPFCILLNLRSEDTYSRVGVLDVFSSDANDKIFEEWFQDAEIGRFQIIWTVSLSMLY